MTGSNRLRVCSLLPSATEIVAAVGMADCLVGVSAECDWPPSVRALPVVTAARIDTQRLSSVEIDAAVRDAIADGRSLYAVDAELIDRLSPELILTQDLCAVCAVSSRELALCPIGTETLALDPRSLRGIEEAVLAVGARLGVPDRGRAVVAAMEARMVAVRAEVAGRPPRRVFVSEWLEPPFAAGHWVPEMVVAGGGIDVLGRPREPSFPTTWEIVRELEPELVVLAPCGFDARRAGAEAAVPDLDCTVVAVDANAYFSRPAPRVAEGVAQLAHLFHPDLPNPGLPYIEVAGSIA
jgi:iron complex transport system substrate-binding protein